MKEWSSYSGRLMWAMRRAGKTNQSELARLVGVKPQSIQYLCDPDSGAQGSTHTPALARELGVMADWLARGEGQPDGMAHAPVVAESMAGGYATRAADLVVVSGTLRMTGSTEGERLEPAARAGEGQLQMPGAWAGLGALRIKGDGLSPYAKDGQFLLLLPVDQMAEPEDNVLLWRKDGRIGVRELMVRREDSLVLLPIAGGQPEVVELKDIDQIQVVACVLPRRWWRGP